MINKMTSNIFLFLTILLAPLYVLRFKLGPLPTTLLEALIGLTVLSFILERLIASDSLTHWKKRLASPFTWPALALLAVSLIAVIVSPSHYQAFGLWRAYFLEPVVIYIILLSKLTESHFTKLFLIAWFGSATWIAAIAIAQKIYAVLHPSLYDNPRLNRPEAVFNSANDVALFVGPLAAFSVALVRLHKALIVIILLLFTAIWISGSRGGMVGLGSVELLLLLALLWRQLSPRWQKVSLQISAALVVIALAVSAALFFNLGTYQAPPQTTYQRPYIDTAVGRVCVWQATRNMLLDHPILGVGIGGFHLSYPQYRTCNAEDLQYPHNIFLNIWAELGLAGLAAFAWIYFIAIRLITRSSGHWVIKTAFLGALVYSLIHGLVDAPYFKNDLSLEFWILLAAIAAFQQNKPSFTK